MSALLTVLGYIINSALLLIIVFAALRIWLEGRIETGATVKDIPLGPLTEEVSDIILSQGGKFIPLKERKALLFTVIAVCLLLIYIVYKVLI